jgi:rRNA-processing protein FCF1
MKIAVTDTNIFIYLIKANLLRGLFEIGYEVHTTNLVLHELGEEGNKLLEQYISDGKLTVYSFSMNEIQQIEKIILPNGLSFEDKGIYFYVTFWNGPILLTNDGLLRKTSIKKEIEVHGILWVLDILFEEKTFSSQDLADGLKKMLAGYHRLPMAECEIRLKAWGN